LLKKPGINPDDPMSEAGRKTFRFHYRRMLFHEPGTRLGEDIEALHDMRVATRRMRAAFRTFDDYYDPKVMRPLLKGLRQTGRMLGAVRDLDVFRAKTQAYLETLPESQRSSLGDFLALLEERRETARQAMITYLNSARYRRFKECYGEFVETRGMGSLPVAPGEGEPRPYRVRYVVPVAIYQRLAAVRAYDEWVSTPHPPTTQLHALRIACKRLRYTLEFFDEVLGPAAQTLVKEVVAVQDHLGELQDAVVASGILRDFLVWGTWGPDTKRPPAASAAPVIAPGVAAYLAVRQLELQRLLDKFPQAWQRLNNAQCSGLVAEAVSAL
jgi:CHAD domain-containing protein